MLRSAVWLVAGTALASWCLLALVHFDDGYLVNHVSGAWMALAMYVNEGILYPPLFDGEHFGGTRHMPFQFVLHAGLARLLGDYLEAGRVLGYAVAVTLATIVWLVLRRQFFTPAWLAAGLVACLVMTPVGQLGTLSIRGHALPVALQIAALALLASRTARPAVVAAGVLFGLALLTKLTAVWGVLAAFVWLWTRRRNAALIVAASFAGVVLVGIACIELLSDGRFSENLLTLSTSAFDVSPPALVASALRKLVSLSETSADAAWLLTPIAALGVALSLRRRELSLYQLALVAALIVTAVVMADSGAGDSHLLDLQVLVVLVVGEVWRDQVARATPERAALVSLLIAVTVLLAITGSYATQLAAKTREAAEVALGRESNRFAFDELDALVPPGTSVLSEDPTVAVRQGRLPVVLDAFMLVRIARSHPEWVRTLEERIARKEFDRVVLFHRPGFRLEGDDPFWRDTHFGSGVIDAIARSYRREGVAGGYEILVPRAG